MRGFIRVKNIFEIKFVCEVIKFFCGKNREGGIVEIW
jgi:hypothetical protein